MNCYIGSVSGLGRGVFAAKDIRQGEVIEVCNVIVIPEDEVQYADKTIIGAYYYTWGEDYRKAALALGNGSLYNHSYEPNAKYVKHFENDTLEFTCIKDVKKDEEIRVNYNGVPDDKSPMWFEAV